MVAGACHWRTLLQICHDSQGSSGGNSIRNFQRMDSTFFSWIFVMPFYTCRQKKKTDGVIIFLKQRGYPDLERHWISEGENLYKGLLWIARCMKIRYWRQESSLCILWKPCQIWILTLITQYATHSKTSWMLCYRRCQFRRQIRGDKSNSDKC